MMSELWNQLDDEDICVECGAYPAKQQCKICFEPLCKSCSRRNHGKCSDCLDEDKEYDDEY
jgi:hypothetical protein